MRKWLPTFATLLFLSLSPAPAATGRAADPPKEEAKDKKDKNAPPPPIKSHSHPAFYAP